MNRTFLSAVAVVFCLALPCLAGSDLSIRLVEIAGPNKQGIEGSLQDVIETLRKNLADNEYRLVAATNVALPAAKAVMILDKYSVKCSGKQQNLALSVSHGKKPMVKTVVELQDNKPLILGPFAGTRGRGKMILVFVVK